MFTQAFPKPSDGLFCHGRRLRHAALLKLTVSQRSFLRVPTPSLPPPQTQAFTLKNAAQGCATNHPPVKCPVKVAAESHSATFEELKSKWSLTWNSPALGLLIW